jgi:imidazolonepropionase-like amidohydrolase
MARRFLTNANLLDGDAPAQSGRTIAVEGERIKSVTSELPPDVGGDDEVVDVGGRTVMPGMITCHYHSTYRELGAAPAPYGLEHPPAYQALIAADNLRTALECGFTGAVGAGSSNDIDASMKRAIDDGLIPGPRFVPSGRELSTTGHANDANPWYWDLREWGAARCCDGPEEFRAAVRDELKRGVEIIKLFVTGGHLVMAPKGQMEMTRSELDAVVETAHARGALVRGHIVNKPAILMALDAGVDVIDHADELDDECIERAVDAGAFVAPSCYLPTSILESMGGQGFGFTESIQAELQQMLDVLPKANAAGVKLVLGDDYGAGGFPHGKYANELEVYVRDASIAPLDVLRWATVHGAELMGRGHELGRIASGYLADLLVIDGDPSRDITVLQDRDRLVGIMKNGDWFKDPAPVA